MSEKLYFVVSRKFQVERYQNYVCQLGFSKEAFEFICISNWTGGDALESLTNEPYYLLPRPKLFKKLFFASPLQYVFCTIKAWLNFLAIANISPQQSHSIVFIDQYFSPLEFLAISKCLNIKTIIFHQHSFNHINQLYNNTTRAIFAKMSHHLVQKYFLFRFKIKLKYFGAFYSKKAKALASRMQGFSEIFLIKEEQLTNLISEDLSISKKKISKSLNEAVILSPGMFRYKKSLLKQAQKKFFEKSILSLKKINSNIVVNIRPKPGECFLDYPRLCSYKILESKNEIPFSKTLESHEFFVCPSVSTTWLQVIAAEKSLVVVRQQQLETEYPFFSDLFQKLISETQIFVALKKNEIYFLRGEDTPVVSKTLRTLLISEKGECSLDLKDLMSCVR